jgi:hypothetical protein
MLTSLFGELSPLRNRYVTEDAIDDGFAATAIFEVSAPAIQARAIDPHVVDLFVTGLPALAIREHLATARADLETAGAMISLVDPSRLWAPAVIKSLSDSAGQPVEKVQLRERATLRTLATIERAAVLRRVGLPLKVYHADIRAPGEQHDEIANALAERSHMTAVIIGTLQPNAIDVLLRSLLAATRQKNWHCPWLVFLLPPNSAALQQLVLGQDWPTHIHTAALSESLTDAPTVWHTVLTAWEATQTSVQVPETPPEPEPDALSRSLVALARTDGVLACGIVELQHGELISLESRASAGNELVGAARALCIARAAHASATGSAGQPADELLVTDANRVQMLRAGGAPGRPGVVLLLDRAHANLALVRFKLIEIERNLH